MKPLYNEPINNSVRIHSPHTIGHNIIHENFHEMNQFSMNQFTSVLYVYKYSDPYAHYV